MLTREILDRVFQLHPELVVYNIYGLTEAGRACYRKIHVDSPFSHSIGRPSCGVEITIDGTIEQPGEILIKGPNVAKGYLRGIIDERMDLWPCDVVETGDLGYWDENGEVILVGRKDHVINIMGEKINPTEIESLAMQIPGVDDAIAEPIKDEQGTVSIRLNVVCTDLDACRRQLEVLFKKRLSKIFIPAEICALPIIERTEIGSKAVRSKEGE